MKEGRKRRILLIVAAGAAVISLLAGWYFTLRKGIFAGGQFYYKISETRYEQNNLNYIERVSENDFAIVSDAGSKTVSVKTDGDSLLFVFSDGTALAGAWDGTRFMDSEGMPVGWDIVQVSIGNEAVEVSDAAYCQALCGIYYGKEETISKWYIQLMGVVVYLLGTMTVLHPDEMHFFLIRWRYKNPVLSESGRLLEQIGGVALCVIGIGIMTGGVLMLATGSQRLF